MPRMRYEYTYEVQGVVVSLCRRGLTGKSDCWTRARLAASVEKKAHDIFHRPACVGSGPGEPWVYVGSAYPNGGVYKAKKADNKIHQNALGILEDLRGMLSGTPTCATEERESLEDAIGMAGRLLKALTMPKPLPTVAE